MSQSGEAQAPTTKMNPTPLDHSRSRALFERAQALIPGGVNSPARAFRAVGGDPIFFERGEGSLLFDVE